MNLQLVCAMCRKAIALGLARTGRTAIALCSVAPLLASASNFAAYFAAADQAAAEFRLGDMQQAYEQILNEDPGNVRAIAGRAAALSWQGDFATAQQAYQRALAIEPNNVDARVGLGYALAWNDDYAKAHTEFNRVLLVDPMHLGARKGIGYSYMWSEEYGLALESFDIATSIAPQDPEILEAIGTTHLLQGHNSDAIENFDRALAIQPDRYSAEISRLEAYRSAPALELTAIAGTTSGADAGVRRVEVGHWTDRSTRLAVRYDNSLGLDTPSVADRDSDAHSYFLTASHRFRRGVTVIAEAGRRELSGGDQNVGAIQSVFETRRGAVRVGAQLGDHELGYTEKLVYSGFKFRVGDDWQLEPVVYAAESGTAKDKEWRVVMNAERQFGFRMTAGAFAGVGAIDAQNVAFDGDTSMFGGWLRFELDGRYAFTASVRQELTPSRDFTVAEVGISFRLPGNVGR